MKKPWAEEIVAPTWLRLRQKARLLSHELRWRTGATPTWFRRPVPQGCALLPHKSFLLSPEQRRRVARLLLKQRPDAARQTVAAADDIVSGKHYLWGRPVEGVVSWSNGLLPDGWPRRPFWRLSLEGDDAPGDVKLAWEPSRHLQFLVLARAFSLTGDPAYAHAWADQLQTWMAENPAWVGIQWASPLELAFRVLSWGWSAAHFADAPELGPTLWEQLTRAVALHAQHIATHLTPRRPLPSNHRLGEAVGLIAGSVCLPRHPKAHAWRKKGLLTLADSLRHGLAEGIIWDEGSTAYHFLALELTVIAWALLRSHGQPVPPVLPGFVARLLEGADVLMPGADSATRWGDDDDYRLCDPLQQGAGRGRLGVEVASRMTGEPLPWPDVAWHPTVPWLLGPDLPAQPGRRVRPGVRLTRSVTRWDGRGTSCYVFGHAPVEQRVPGHAHADLLSLCLFAEGEPVVLDPGTFSYGEAGPWRDRFRTTGAHATVVVDGTSQLRPGGRFGWKDAASVTWNRRANVFGLALLRGEHDAYARFGVSHRRVLLFSPDGVVLLRDQVEGTGNHTISQRFLLPEHAVQEADGGRELVVTVGTGAFRISATTGPVWRLDERGSLGWCSAAYGLRRPAVLAQRDLSVELPTALDAVVQPGDADPVSAGEGAVLLRAEDSLQVMGVRAAPKRDVTAALPHPLGNLRSDATALHVVLTKRGTPLAARLIDASTLEISSQPVIVSPELLSGLSVTWDESGAHVASLEPWSRLQVAATRDRLKAAGAALPLGGHFTCPTVSA